MDDKEKIQSFGDMVDATDKMSKPWRETVHKMIIALCVTNFLWALIVGMLVWFAYMTPAEMTQEQDLTEQRQTQSYTEGATNGG